MITTQSKYTRFARVSLVLSVALMVLATMAAPAFAEDDLLIVDLILQAEAVPAEEPEMVIGQLIPLLDLELVDDPEIGDGGGFEMVPAEELPIGDGGDWEMFPGESPVFPDAGDDEMVPSDDVTETPEPDEPNESQDETPTPEPEEPSEQQEADEPTETVEPDPEPETPIGNDEDSLPFTGGNGTPYTVAGIAIALAGASYLLRKRYVFDRD